MNETRNSNAKAKKTLAAVLAIAMILVMLLSGTLAYYIHSNETNELQEDMLTKKVIAHDDFDPDSDNKDLYLENLDTARVYVRVKLTEDFKISTGEGNDLAEYTETNVAALNPKLQAAATGVTPKYDYTHNEDGTTDPILSGQHVHALAAGETATDGSPDFNHKDDEYFHQNLFTWTMGGVGKDYLSADDTAAYNRVETQNEADEIDGVFLGGDNNMRQVAHDNFGNGLTVKADGNKGQASAAEFIKTGEMPDASLITAAAYKALVDAGNRDVQSLKTSGTLNDGHWILDNADGVNDGWYYWSRPLKKGEVTGLLLDKVVTNEILKHNDYNYEYHIHVKFEAVDDRDAGIWLKGKTQDADGNLVNTDKCSATMKAILEDMGAGENNEGYAAAPDENNNMGVPLSAVTTVTGPEITAAQAALGSTDSAAYALYNQAKAFVGRGEGRTAARFAKDAKRLGTTVDHAKVGLEITNITTSGANTTYQVSGDFTTSATLGGEIVQGVAIAFKDVSGVTLNNGSQITKDQLKAVYNLILTISDETKEEVTRVLTKENFPNLQALFLKGAIDQELVSAIGNEFGSQLTHLELNGADDTFGGQNVDLQNYSALEFLQLSHMRTHWFKNCQAPLRSITIYDSKDWTTQDVSTYRNTLENVYLRFSGDSSPDGTTVKGLNQLPKLLKCYLQGSNIQKVNLSASPKLTEVSIYSCPQLTGIKLPDSVDAFAQDRISDSMYSGFAALGMDIKNCTSLTELDISKTGWPDGKTINLSGCTALTHLYYKDGIANPFTGYDATKVTVTPQ